ncbi:MAG: hypothetical protein K8H88_00830, partial [Sandaracinaceae bacterium]|nr:hypothetical protein [Sandaracinaceae bacterium]
MALAALAACGSAKPDTERPENERDERPANETASPGPAAGVILSAKTIALRVGAVARVVALRAARPGRREAGRAG